MDAEKMGKRLRRMWRLVFWFIGLCGLVSILLGITEDNITLIAGGLLMICAAPGSEFIHRNATNDDQAVEE